MSKKTIRRIRNGLLAAALVFIALGLARGEAAEVFHRAVEICLSCIGIG